MDPLSDVLRVVRLDGAYFYAVETSNPWSAEAPAAAELTPRVMPTSEHLISYHIILDGRCRAGLIGEDSVELEAGDVVVFAHGDAHLMSSGGTRLGDEIQRTTPEHYPFAVRHGAPGPRATSLLCGFLGCDRRPFNPLLAALPRRLHVRGVTNSGLGIFIQRLTEEASAGRSGAAGVVTRLAEMMFIEVLRRYLDELPPGQTGWLAGLRDEVVGRALTALHQCPGHRWTLVELAREAATSRTALTKRFTEFVGQPPMQYLTHWRMQVAANRLAQTGATIASIGGEVGYDSEAAFSRAFKKVTGQAPGSWRAARRRTPA